jgi:hypothetical protein
LIDNEAITRCKKGAVSLSGSAKQRHIKLDRRKDEENNKLLDYINFCQKKGEETIFNQRTNVRPYPTLPNNKSPFFYLSKNKKNRKIPKEMTQKK